MKYLGGCFCFLAIGKNDDRNIGMQVSESLFSVLDVMLLLCLTLRNCHCFPQWLYHFISLSAMHEKAPVFPHPSRCLLLSVCLFDSSHYSVCEVKPHCDFDLREKMKVKEVLKQFLAVVLFRTGST